MTDTARLRPLAEKALGDGQTAWWPEESSPGHDPCPVWWVMVDAGGEPGQVAETFFEEDARYIAAANPAAILALLDTIADYENGVTWMTTCTNCAKLMDSDYANFARTEQAEAALAAAQQRADEWQARAEGLEGALERYGEHEEDCLVIQNGCDCVLACVHFLTPGPQDCTCGYIAALALAPSAPEGPS